MGATLPSVNLLVVCSGNICRSPMAEGILRALLGRAPSGHEVKSAGTLDIVGRPPAGNAQLTAGERGVDLRAKRSCALDASLLDWADVVLGMERAHLDVARARARGPLPRLQLLGAEEPALPGGEIPDPVGQGLEAFDECCELLWRCCERFLAREGLLRYAQCWCEENIWHLLSDPRLQGRERYAVVLSNATHACAMWGQRATKGLGPVFWDYHAVVLARGDEGWEVWDLDCVAGWPLPLERWLELSFGPVPVLPADLAPVFRVVDGGEYRRRFSSDRGHMRDSSGSFRQPLPPWPPVVPPGEPPNLTRFIDVERPFLGEVLGLEAFRERFLRPR